MERNEDHRGKRIVFAASCILNGNNKVRGLTRYPGMYSRLISLLDTYGIGIQQMDCPETLYLGIQRWSATKNLYDCIGFRRLCRDLAVKIVDYLQAYKQMNYDIVGFLCVNGSPSCGLDITCWDDNWGGTPMDFGDMSTLCPGKGVFIEELEKEIQSRELQSPDFYGLDIEDWDVDINDAADRLAKLLSAKYG